MNNWIGVDLDGTLVHYDGWEGIDHLGKPIKLMCDRVRTWLKEGKEVRIFTARVTEAPNLDKVRAPIEEFCQREFGQVLKITNIKDYGLIELWDDRAVQVEPNTGRRVDGND